MGLDLNRKEELRKEFYHIRSFLKQAQNSDHRVHLFTWLKQTSRSVIIFVDQGLIDCFYLDEIIKLGAHVRLNNFNKLTKDADLSLDPFTALEWIRRQVYQNSIPLEKPKSLPQIKQNDFTILADEVIWIIQHAYKKLLKKDLSLSSKFSLISNDEYLATLEKLEIIKEKNLIEIETEINQKEAFLFLKNNNFMGLDEAYKFLIKSASNKSEGIKKDALKILTYLIEEDDIIPDEIGIFGLNDDIELINKFYIENNKTLGQALNHNIVRKFSNINQSGFQYIDNNKKLLKKIHPIMMIPLSLALDSERKGGLSLNIITQQVGVLPYLFLYALSIEDHYLVNNKKEFPELHETFFVGFGKNKLRMVLRKKYRNDSGELYSIYFDDGNFMVFSKNKMREIYKNKLPIDTQGRIKKRIIFHTKKDKFQEIKDEILPYGESFIKNLGPIRYLNREGKKDKDIFGKNYKVVGSGKNSQSQLNKFLKFKQPVSPFNYNIDDIEILIVPSTNQALKEIQSSSPNIPTVYISDQPSKTEKLLSYINKEFLPDNISYIVFSDKSQIRRSSRSLEKEPYNFLTWIIDKEISGIPMTASIVNSDNLLFSQERNLYKSYKKTLFKDSLIDNHVISNLYLLIKKAHKKKSDYKAANSLDNEYLSNLCFLLRGLQREILEYPIEFSNEKKEKIEKRCEELIDVCDDGGSNFDEEIKIFLDGHIEVILNIGNIRQNKIIELLNKNPDLDKILVRTKKDAERLNTVNFYNNKVTFLSYDEIKNMKYSDNIIYPVFPFGDMKDFVASGGFASKVYCVMFKEEFNFFKKIISNLEVNNKHNVLNRNKQTAEKLGYDFFTNIEIPEFQNINILDDDEKEQLDLYKEMLDINEGDYKDGAHDLHEAHLVILDNQRSHIFLPVNGKVDVLITSNNFIDDIKEISVEDLGEGDLIYLPKQNDKNIRDLVSDALGYVSEKDREYSKIWKSALKDYIKEESIDLKELTKRLESHGCKRNINTIKNWLLSETTIAPRDIDSDISSILNLTQGKDSINEKNKCKKGIDRVYKGRDKAWNKLKSEISNKKLSININEFSIHINGREFLFDISEVDLIDEEISHKSYSQMHKFIKHNKQS